MEATRYWNPSRLMSYNKLISFAVGPRGVGKTYAAKKWVIDHFIKNGEQFIYLRRYKTEIKQNQINKFWDDIRERYPDLELEVKGREFRINGQVAGWAIALSEADTYKSVPFPGVRLIIFDEFILSAGARHYLSDEVRVFLDFYSTVSRDRDIRALLLANSLSWSNPYFEYFDIQQNGKGSFTRKQEIVVEWVESLEHEHVMNDTRFGALVANTPYGDYAIGNELLYDLPDFICKRPVPERGEIQPTVILESNGSFYVCYAVPFQSYYWIDYLRDLTLSERVKVFTIGREPKENIPTLSSSTNRFWLRDMYRRGLLWFSNAKIKADFVSSMKNFVN